MKRKPLDVFCADIMRIHSEAAWRAHMDGVVKRARADLAATLALMHCLPTTKQTIH